MHIVRMHQLESFKPVNKRTHKSKLQKEVIYTQKQPGCKKGVVLFKSPVGKSCEIKWGSHCDGMQTLMAKILITTIQVNFMLISSEAGMRKHKLTWIVVTKIFAINLYHHDSSPFYVRDCLVS